MARESTLGRRTITVFFVAAASIGWTAGFLAGQSGPHANVLAAVLPVVISGAGGALVFLHLLSCGRASSSMTRMGGAFPIYTALRAWS